MEGKQLENFGNHDSKDAVVATECGVNQSRRDFRLGDIIWIKMHDFSWWPAQVVDESTASRGKRIKNRIEGGVLTRLYGSYEYLYVDPVRCMSEFEHVLKQNNGSTREILMKALEQDLSRIKSSAKLKGKASGLKVEEKAGNASYKNKVSKQGRVKKRLMADDPDSAMTKGSPDTSVRRIRVMQNLGLIAPCGSPFQRDVPQKQALRS